MKQTLAQKLVARAAGRSSVTPGEIVTCKVVEAKESWTIRAADSESTQGYTPFEGIELGARVKATFLRGALVCENGNVRSAPRGKYLHRPTA